MANRPGTPIHMRLPEDLTDLIDEVYRRNAPRLIPRSVAIVELLRRGIADYLREHPEHARRERRR